MDDATFATVQGVVVQAIEDFDYAMRAAGLTDDQITNIYNLVSTRKMERIMGMMQEANPQ